MEGLGLTEIFTFNWNLSLASFCLFVWFGFSMALAQSSIIHQNSIFQNLFLKTLQMMG